jgi:hypothetical protein
MQTHGQRMPPRRFLSVAQGLPLLRMKNASVKNKAIHRVAAVSDRENGVEKNSSWQMFGENFLSGLFNGTGY